MLHLWLVSRDFGFSMTISFDFVGSVCWKSSGSTTPSCGRFITCRWFIAMNVIMSINSTSNSVVRVQVIGAFCHSVTAWLLSQIDGV